MQLIIQNTTKRNHQLHFRVPEVKDAMYVNIPAGGQSKVWKNDIKEIIEFILDQFRPYGIRPADEIDSSSDYIGMTYTIDHAEDVDRIMSAIEHNDEVLNDQAVENAKLAAAATHHDMATRAQQHGLKAPNAVHVEFEELPKPGTPTTKGRSKGGVTSHL